MLIPPIPLQGITQYLTKMPFLNSIPSINPMISMNIYGGISLPSLPDPKPRSPPHMRRWSPPPRADPIGGQEGPRSPPIRRPAGGPLPSGLAQPTSPGAWRTAEAGEVVG